MGKFLTQRSRLRHTCLTPMSAAVALAVPLCLFAPGVSAADADEVPGLPGGDIPEASSEPSLDPLQEQLRELNE